jgi:hypothetical protein
MKSTRGGWNSKRGRPWRKETRGRMRGANPRGAPSPLDEGDPNRLRRAVLQFGKSKPAHGPVRPVWLLEPFFAGDKI